VRSTAQTAFTRLLEDYCRSTGMGDFEIGPEGGVFEVGEDVAVTVTHDADFGRLAMIAAVAPATPEQIQLLAPILLQLNVALGAMGGFSFCADLESAQLLPQRSMPLETMNPEQFDVELADMAAKCRSARDLVTTLEEGPEAARQVLEQAGRAETPLVTFRI
jgi:hypothetical protein